MGEVILTKRSTTKPSGKDSTKTVDILSPNEWESKIESGSWITITRDVPGLPSNIFVDLGNSNPYIVKDFVSLGSDSINSYSYLTMLVPFYSNTSGNINIPINGLNISTRVTSNTGYYLVTQFSRALSNNEYTINFVKVYSVNHSQLPSSSFGSIKISNEIRFGTVNGIYINKPVIQGASLSNWLVFDAWWVDGIPYEMPVIYNDNRKISSKKTDQVKLYGIGKYFYVDNSGNTWDLYRDFQLATTKMNTIEFPKSLYNYEVDYNVIDSPNLSMFGVPTSTSLILDSTNDYIYLRNYNYKGTITNLKLLKSGLLPNITTSSSRLGVGTYNITLNDDSDIVVTGSANLTIKNNLNTSVITVLVQASGGSGAQSGQAYDSGGGNSGAIVAVMLRLRDTSKTSPNNKLTWKIIIGGPGGGDSGRLYSGSSAANSSISGPGGTITIGGGSGGQQNRVNQTRAYVRGPSSSRYHKILNSRSGYIYGETSSSFTFSGYYSSVTVGGSYSSGRHSNGNWFYGAGGYGGAPSIFGNGGNGSDKAGWASSGSGAGAGSGGTTRNYRLLLPDQYGGTPAGIAGFLQIYT